jgi:hypothetical protein
LLRRRSRSIFVDGKIVADADAGVARFDDAKNAPKTARQHAPPREAALLVAEH